MVAPTQHDRDMRGFLPSRLRGARLAARQGAGVSQQRLAAAVGVSQATISDYERGRRTPSLEALLAISRELGVTLGWLLDDPQPVYEHPDKAALLSQEVSQLLGLNPLKFLGTAGTEAGSNSTGSAPRAAADVVAAETTAQYGSHHRPALESTILLDKSLAAGARWIVLYCGPPSGRIQCGDYLMVAPIARSGRASHRIATMTNRLFLYSTSRQAPEGSPRELYVLSGSGAPPAPHAELLGEVTGSISLAR